MGFTRQQAVKALKETNNNMERAVDWLFSHSDEPMEVHARKILCLTLPNFALKVDGGGTVTSSQQQTTTLPGKLLCMNDVYPMSVGCCVFVVCV